MVKSVMQALKLHHEIMTFFIYIYVQAELILTTNIYVLSRVCSSQMTTLAMRILSDLYVYQDVCLKTKWKLGSCATIS